MREDFAIFVLSYGRPNDQKTLRMLEIGGYEGRWYIIVGTDDASLPQYIEQYGDRVIVFDKGTIACDTGDNMQRMDTVLFARNACFKIAKKIGVKYFMELDDDYTQLQFRVRANGYYAANSPGCTDVARVIDALLDFFIESGATSVAFAQSGDFIGAGRSAVQPRKCMNSFICCVDRPFEFIGRMNDDVNTYARLGNIGHVFLTVPFISVKQARTQKTHAGLTDMHLALGTYVKSFYTVMYQPSSVLVSSLNTSHARIHHRIKWDNTVPCIISEKYRLQ